MLKTFLFASALTVAGTSLALAQNWGGQDYRAQGWQDQRGGYAPYGYNDSGTSLGRYCPPGYYPHSWPTGSGIRCESVDQNSVIYRP